MVLKTNFRSFESGCFTQELLYISSHNTKEHCVQPNSAKTLKGTSEPFLCCECYTQVLISSIVNFITNIDATCRQSSSLISKGTIFWKKLYAQCVLLAWIQFVEFSGQKWLVLNLIDCFVRHTDYLSIVTHTTISHK